MKITIFKDIRETEQKHIVDVGGMLERIKNGSKSKDLIKSIRVEKDSTKRQQLKMKLPSILFSGEFVGRKDSDIVNHSGLICLDFDKYDSQKDMLSDKEKFTKDKFTYSVFISPSGNGLKVLVKIPKDIPNHKLYFNALQKYYNNPHFDTTSKNIARVCYESYDPLIFTNGISSVWEKYEEPEHREIELDSKRKTIKITDKPKIIDILQKWWTKKYPMIEGERNNNAYVFAQACNEFGVYPVQSKNVLSEYCGNGFSIEEMEKVVDSAYRQTEKNNTKFYEDEDRINRIKQQVKSGAPRTEIHRSADDDIESDIIDSIIDETINEADEYLFWSISDRGVVRLQPNTFKHFLEDNGYYKYAIEGSSNYTFVKVINNLIEATDVNDIKDFTLNYLIKLSNIAIYNHFADSTRYFTDNYLSLIDTIDIFFIEDTKDVSYLYYKDCAIKVTSGDVEIIDYIDLGGYVWKDHIIDRNFKIVKVDKHSDYPKFIGNISNNKSDRRRSMESTIGYLMHGYKTPSYAPAVILNDEIISDNPEGGTGKGIFMNALSHMKKVVTIDGKSFSFEKNFAYQLVNSDTQILLFDDIRKHFPFERLFSVVTEGITIEKKNKDSVKVPFEKSPKVAITTNYAIRGAGNSFVRRKWELELHQYYNANYTPLDEFGKMLFSDWDDDEWSQFDNYMISCLQVYMSQGLVSSSFVNLKIRHLSAETSHDFVEWLGLVDEDKNDFNKYSVVGCKINLSEAMVDFISDYPDYQAKSKLALSSKKFKSWFQSYAIYKTGEKAENGRDATSRWFRLKTEQEISASVQTKINI